MNILIKNTYAWIANYKCFLRVINFNRKSGCLLLFQTGKDIVFKSVLFLRHNVNLNKKRKTWRVDLPIKGEVFTI